MRRPRTAFIGVLAALLPFLISCSKEITPDRELRTLLDKLAAEPHQYVYKEKAPGSPALEVAVNLQDQLKYHGILRVDGGDAGEIVVSDDALAVRLIDPSKIPAFQSGTPSIAGSQVIGQSLTSGQWVLDYQAAPPIFPPLSDRGTIIVGQDPFLDAVYVFGYLRRAVEDAAAVWRFNPEDLTVYRKSEDPFPPPSRGAGEERIDILPPPLPGRSARGSQAALPTTAHFRRIAFYIRGGQIVQVREKVDIEGHPDFERARRGKAPEYFLTLLKAVKEGKTQEPIRVIDRTLDVKALGNAVNIELPPQSVLTADLKGVLGSLGFAATAAPQAESGAAPTVPGAPGGEGSPAPAEPPAEGLPTAPSG